MEEIKELALRMAREKGLVNLTCADLSKAAGFPEGSFTARAGCTFTELKTLLIPLLQDAPHHAQTVSRRNPPAVRRDQIIKAALYVAQSKPYNTIKYLDVAEQVGCTRALISHYFHQESDLIAERLRLAVVQEIQPIIKLGLVLGHPIILAAYPDSVW